MTNSLLFKVNNEPWNKGMIIGPKPPLKLKEATATSTGLITIDSNSIMASSKQWAGPKVRCMIVQ